LNVFLKFTKIKSKRDFTLLKHSINQSINQKKVKKMKKCAYCGKMIKERYFACYICNKKVKSGEYVSKEELHKIELTEQFGLQYEC